MSKNRSQGVSRRSFVVGAGAALAGLGLAGCAPSVDSTEENRKGGGNSANATWDEEVDFLVIGSGTAAFGALAASEVEGKSVMLIEKDEAIFGGTSCTSSGGFWIPLSPLQAENGVEDSRDAALAYMKACSEGRGDDATFEAYVDNAAAWLDWARNATGIEFNIGGAQDYYDSREGFLEFGRNSRVVDGNAGLLWQAVQRVLEENGAEVRMGCALTGFYTDDAGNVVGVAALDGNDAINIKAGAVLMGTGGFDYDHNMMRENIPYPISYSVAVQTNTGDGHKAAVKIGAKLALMDTYWGFPCFFAGGAPSDYDYYAATEYNRECPDTQTFRGKPGAIVVNRYGKRFGDEATAYAPYVRPFGQFSTGTLSYENIPAYFICDSDFLANANLPGVQDSGEPNEWFVRADTLEELAEQLGIDAEGLAAEVERFNGFAATGVDEDFHRGEKASGMRIYGQNIDRPELANILLGPIATPPFYGAVYVPGMFGTSGGVKINENAQVINMDGNPIGGLYACGNCSASIAGGGYVGGGGTLGPGSVMAYIAARHALGIS